jgi:hypothetical protein
MLIDFTVSNFRSIKDPVTLSAVEVARGSGKSRQGTGRRRVKPDDEIAHAVQMEGRGISLLPVLGIFGANASGKSNVVRALDTLLWLMFLGTGENRGKPQDIVPFSLDPATRSRPSCFKLRVALQSSVYSYLLQMDKTRVHIERLTYLPKGGRVERLLFLRQWDPFTEKDVWENGRDFVGPHKQFQSTLNQKEVFLSLFNWQIDTGIVTPLASWVRGAWHCSSREREAADLEFARRAASDPTWKPLILEFLHDFDIRITDLEVESRTPGRNDAVFVCRETEHGRVAWPLDDESVGTQRLFGLALAVNTTLRLGGVLLLDEFGSNLHPYITRRIVRLFQNRITNPKGAQIIFNSHDNTLQQDHLLRRDQIWFTRLRKDGSTELYPLSDFSARNDLAIDKAYLDGRFGAVPVLPEEETLPTPELVG